MFASVLIGLFWLQPSARHFFSGFVGYGWYGGYGMCAAMFFDVRNKNGEGESIIKSNELFVDEAEPTAC